MLRRLLAERDFPVGEIRYFASARSAGRTLPWRDRRIPVEDMATADFAGLDIALFSAGKTASRDYAAKKRKYDLLKRKRKTVRPSA